ncbi:hypothetical protein TSUD_185730 [Trifolium subterraneum]|uniref:Uncharacterized protein n=1 Tax=Trifolium subterraneum TaxID=3900 RepID=A0A2Z6MN31_TRISU|nr:hypothetical protein TSUD_185730 [Trifolium subterraneum]
MPGPGPHLMYAMASGLGLTTVTNGRFSPHHTLTYTINSFFGPDIGSFSEWLGSLFGGPADTVGSAVADLIHHPFYYILILGIPLSFIYSRISSFLLHNHLLDSSLSKVSLTKMQCFLLISAGSFTHFFLDHLFEVRESVTAICTGPVQRMFNLRDSDGQFVMALTEWDYPKMDVREGEAVAPCLNMRLNGLKENGKTTMYTWILSTGWWQSRAPVNPDAVVVVIILCACLIGGFFYLNRASSSNSIRKKSYQSMLLMIFIASLYCLWCTIQIYGIIPRRPAVGEEADLGVLVFLAIYFFLPYAYTVIWNLAATVI